MANRDKRGNRAWSMDGVNGQPPPHERELVWIFRKKYNIHGVKNDNNCCKLHEAAPEDADSSTLIKMNTERSAAAGKKCKYVISLDDPRFYELVKNKCQKNRDTSKKQDSKDTSTYNSAVASISHVQGTCFVSGTKITLFSGEIFNIEDITEDLLLLTYNTENNLFESGRVKKLIRSNRKDLVKISLSDGTVIQSTPEHPYFTQKNGWSSVSPESSKMIHDIKISQLESGDLLMNTSGEWIEISNISTIENEEFQTVYNFEIEGNNNYFANNVLVHNKYAGNISSEEFPTVADLIQVISSDIISKQSTETNLSVSTSVRDGQVIGYYMSASVSNQTASLSLGGNPDNKNTYDATRRYEPAIFPTTNADKVSVLNTISTPSQLAKTNIDQQSMIPETPGSDLFRGLQVGGMFGELTGKALGGIVQYMIESAVENKKDESATPLDPHPNSNQEPPVLITMVQPRRPDTTTGVTDIGNKQTNFEPTPQYEWVVEYFERSSGGQLIRKERIFGSRDESDSFLNTINTGGSGVQGMWYKREKGG